MEVVRQENASIVSTEDIDVNVDAARKHGHVRMLPKGYYSELIYCGQRDGHPMLSFTASQDRTDFSPPSPAYLRIIGGGLKQCHGLSTDDAVEYFRDRPGIQGKLTTNQLLQILSAE